MNSRQYFKIRSVLIDINKFCKRKFLSNLRKSKLKIPQKDCSKLRSAEVEELIDNVISSNQHPVSGVYGTDTYEMNEILRSIGDLLSYSEAAFDHTTINYGGSTRSLPELLKVFVMFIKLRV